MYMGNKSSSYKKVPQVIHKSLQNLIEKEEIVLYSDMTKKDYRYTICLHSGKSWLKCDDMTYPMDLLISESTTEKFVYMGKIQKNHFKLIVPAITGLTLLSLSQGLTHIVSLFIGDCREQEFAGQMYL